MKLKFPSVAAIVALTMTLPAAADIIYSNYLNTAIPLDFTGVTINVGSGSLNPFFGGVGVANNVDLQPFRDGTGGSDTILNFSSGTIINSSTTTLASPGGFGGSIDHVGSTFTAGTEGYVGFKLNGANYGWMRVVFTNNTGGAVVKDWAYNNSGSGAAIAVGNITHTGSDVTVDSTYGDFTVASVVTNSVATTNLIKSGTGTTSLSAANSYIGTTTVNAGTLVIATGGSTHASSAVTVSNSGSALVVNGTVNGSLIMNASTTLSGIGTIEGNATVQGTHNAGNADAGIQTFGADLTYSGGASVVNWELSANTTTNAANPDAVFDQIEVAGNLTFSGETTVNLLFNTGTSTVDWNDTLWSTSQSWLLYDVTGSITGFDDNLTLNTTDWLDGDDVALSTIRPLGTFSMSQGVGGIYINYTVVPETSTTLLGALGALALLRRRRR